MATKCLIYCRVSSERQVNEGHGNESQEQRCRAYAALHGYLVEKVFADDGVSGGLFERPAMKQLISHLDKNLTEKFVIIFDDLSRFARDLKVHLLLRSELISRGVKLESPNFVFEDSPEGEFIENVLASKAQLDRQQNRRQVVQKMKARLEAGYWPFCYPRGLVNKKDPVHGKLLVADEPFAGIYKRAIEGFADMIFGTLEEVRQFINQEYKKAGIELECSYNGARLILSQILFAGYIEYKPWNVTRRKGHHDGFVSIDTFNRVQARFEGKQKFGFRKDFDPDFALRQLVTCQTCGGALTGSWNKGRNQRYANYACKSKDCPNRWKVIHKSDIEPKFESLLTKANPGDEVLNLASEVILDVWGQMKASDGIVQAQNEAKLKELDELIGNTKKGMIKTSDEVIRKVYEDELRELMEKRNTLSKVVKPEYSDTELGTATDKVITALKNPLVMWKSDYLEDKRTIFYMYFGKKLPYDRVSGFGTVQLEPSIELIRSSEGDKMRLVEMEGVGPSSA